ncbi:hypothetical protein ACFQ2B_06830 [Streptomyces stramineus]
MVALTANFAAWAGYCATVGRALRTHYGFDDRACAFFDFFAEPAPRPTRRRWRRCGRGWTPGCSRSAWRTATGGCSSRTS